jgi:hypothetical protein
MPMSFKISSEFGAVEQVRNNVPHTGIDLVIPEGTKLRPIIDGVVEQVLHNPKIGNGVIIQAQDGTHHIYGHLSKVYVHVGDKLQAGKSIIGLSGNTGNSTGAHLHFAVQAPDGRFLDPTPSIQQLSAVTGDISIWQKFWDTGAGASVNKSADWAADKEMEWLLKPIGLFIKKAFLASWHLLVANLPEIMGYGAMLAGICIILGAMIGRGGMIKPIAIYTGLFFIAALILGYGGDA